MTYLFAKRPDQLPSRKGGGQHSLPVTTPGGAFEQEADRLADRVVAPERGAENSGTEVASSGIGLRSEPSAGGESLTAPPVVQHALNSPGQSLDRSSRQHMEAGFGFDFSRVRIHADESAAAANRVVNSQAFTVGQDVVFGEGQFRPHTANGQRLLAHELTHVVQQSRVGTLAVQRKTLFGPTSGAPADWDAQVKAATSSTDRAALLQKAVGVPVTDVTAASAGDASPLAAKLSEFSSSSQRVNYDEHLNNKQSPLDHHPLTDDAGYTLPDGGKFYIILGPKALDGGRYYFSLTILNHELDHVQQNLAGVQLKGNEWELDAWTTSFIRDFHRTYLLGDTGSTCYVDETSTWTQVLDYYHRRDVHDPQRDRCAKRIEDYYNTTLKGNDAHAHAFKYWLYRSIKRGITPSLADRLNTDLALGISASDPADRIRQFPCGTMKTQTYSPPSLNTPTFPSTTAKAKNP